MGITGLLPLVKPIMQKKSIKAYAGSAIGIDGHAWLHQALPVSASDLYFNKMNDKYIAIFMSKVDSLLDNGIRPVVVFDGDSFAPKSLTNAKRKAQRDKCKMEIEFFIKNNNMAKARELMKRCVSVTPLIVYNLIKALVARSIEYIISPYEADAQLYYLQKIKYIDYILTEDSDLIPYGGTRILYKYNGVNVEEYNADKLHKCRGSFFSENILDICILSGCDYADSIKGVGLNTAHKKLEETRTVKNFIELMASSKKSVPSSYMSTFLSAKLTFLHHIVFDPVKQCRVHLNETSLVYDFLGTLENMPYIVKSEIGEDICVLRHIIYRSTETCVEAIQKKSGCDDSESLDVDMNTISPYFAGKNN
ncbi:exonuclease 1 [Enteropsectra breve]|nr:exonuclease 1 [Enteropsectra breve]